MSAEHFQALAKGARLNQYEMVGILGAGGFGITYMARDTTLDTLVAIKEYLPGDFAMRQDNSKVTAKSETSKGDFDWGLSRFLDEARVLAKFRHPNIVRVNQIFEANNTAYLVMEYEKGEPLEDLLKRMGPLSERQTKDILFPILDGLKRVHELGFLHRDIKPGNIIIRADGGAVLIDFGAARQSVETRTRAITSIVTEGYAPLEQYDTTGHQGAWTDIYALGGVAYRCLTGKKPPSATSRVRNDPLVPLAVATDGQVSPEFAAAIESALRVYENERPQTIAEFEAIMSGAAAPRSASPAGDATRVMNMDETRVMPSASGRAAQPSMRVAQPASARVAQPVSARVEAPPPQPAPAASGIKPAYIGVGAAAALLLAAGGWFYFSNPTPPQPAPESSIATAGEPSAPAPAPEPNAVASAPPASAPAPSAPAQPAPAANVAAAPPPPAKEAAAPQSPPPPPIRTSFDCATANTMAERIICSDSQLAALDVNAAQLYQRGLGAVADANAFAGEQVTWLSQRNQCANKQCLITSYNDRIVELRRWVPQ